MKIWVKANTGKAKSMYKEILTKFNLEESENISISKQKDLVLEYGIYLETKDRYPELMKFIVSQIQ